jgi:hypothetical protein
MFIVSFQLQAQEDKIHTSFPLNNRANQRMVEVSNFAFTAIALKSKEISDFSSIGFIINSDTIYFNNNLHVDNTDGYFYSSLIHFEQALKSINLHVPEEVQDLNVVLINGSGEYSDFSNRRNIANQSTDCELNDVIQQSEWRLGLPEPSYSRIFTDTGNMIIHHSAGSNNITDFTQAVRDIYIYHTVENGWSDIGYNYLVAPNGMIYAGRDPDIGEQDKVMGAHFCGSNSKTMGICLIGNYETIEPTSELLQSLESLLSWKAFKDDLQVLDSDFHPLNPELGVIAGHQDGCSTFCPGENVYAKLQQIRENVNSELVICRDYEGDDDGGGDGDGGEDEGGEGDDDGGGDDNEVEGDKNVEEPIVLLKLDSIINQKIYPNPLSGGNSFRLRIAESSQADLQFIRIFSQAGKQIEWENIYFSENRIEVKLPNSLKPGVYFLQTRFSNGKEISQRFVVQ